MVSIRNAMISVIKALLGGKAITKCQKSVILYQFNTIRIRNNYYLKTEIIDT